jgi:hypothetical protein
MEEKKTTYLCPACFFLSKKTIISLSYGSFNCYECQKAIETSSGKEKLLRKTFAHHNKAGYRCPSCSRFLPHPFNNNQIICPYYDCSFVGSISSLKKMFHPTVKTNYFLNKDKKELPQIKKDIPQLSIIKNIITDIWSMIDYQGAGHTRVHRYATLTAISNILDKHPDDMINYFFNGERLGLQAKIFQEYVSAIEKSLPITYRKNKKIFNINSIMNEELGIFDGISIFEEKVSERLEIKNGTKEIYIGGRNATYIAPFYIGKLLSIIDKEKNISLIDNIISYSFSSIKMENVVSGTNVIVSHARIVPHYQLGSMNYISQMMKEIKERIRCYEIY